MTGSAPLDGPEPLENAVLIAGPTASGKSALALKVAEAIGGVIVNADSMQVYSVLRVLTARPGEADLARAVHRLYGHVSPDRAYSTGAWLRDVAALAAERRDRGRRLVFTGGTGLYFRALTGGLSDVPQVPGALRERWRERLLQEGPAALHGVLVSLDPTAAAGIRPGDGQRIVRALEIVEHTGRPLAEAMARPGRPLVDAASATFVVVDPDRALLRQRIDARFDAMVENGALDEVADLLSLGLDPALPAMKAIGVRELAGVLRGECSLDDALERAKAATRQYAKRQLTWFRNQFGPEWRKVGIEKDLANIGLPLTD